MTLGSGPHPALRDLPLLRFMPDEVRKLVEESFVPASFPFGAVIVRETEEADAFYVLVSGSAPAVKNGEGGEEVPLNVLKPGDGFGEVALLEGGTRTATVRASSEVEALRPCLAIERVVHEHADLRRHFVGEVFAIVVVRPSV